ncbi:MAG: LCP family protein [Chloroflexi bacterium]|nr:LCP family protein [Chloroflexota bacterium]
MQRSNRTSLPGWLVYALGGAFVFSMAAVLVFAWLTYQIIVNREVNPLGGPGQAQPVLTSGEGGPAPVPTMIVGRPTPTTAPTRVPWTGTDRVNILLMGIDRRPGEPFISRTDTLMLLSYDPVGNTASILSIPRDLYVNIPGYGRDRINTAFVYGSLGNNPRGGAELAMQTIQYNLGVPVHHYLMVDFSAVEQGVDALGGIEVNVPSPINDPQYPDMNYGYDPLYIPASLQQFDGKLALKYARTRHGNSDINRAERQQQVVLAVRDKALSLGLPQLIAQAPFFYNQLEQGIRTDLSLDELIKLAWAVGDIPAENIYNEVIGLDMVSSYQTPQGASVLILDNAKAAPLIQRLFYE